MPKDLETLQTELKSAMNAAFVARGVADRAAASTSDWNSPEYREKSIAYWKARQKVVHARRAIVRLHKIEAAKYDPVFVTWKTYGFRHIVALEEDRRIEDSHYGPYTAHTGVAFCGNEYSWITYDTEPEWRTRRENEIHGTKRPLCGTCRKHWKKLTGKELS